MFGTSLKGVVVSFADDTSFMTIDLLTMDVAGGIVAFACGLFLFLNWWQDQTGWAPFWWGAADCGVGIGVSLLAFNALLPDYASSFVAPLIFQVCAALIWTAAYIFNRGSIKTRPVIAFISVGIFIYVFVRAYSKSSAEAFSIGLKAVLFAAAAVEFWLSRREPLRSRWLMVGLLLLYAAVVLALLTKISSRIVALPNASLGWSASVHFVALLFEVGTAICLVSMLKQRYEAKNEAAALIDPLTGIANRRAFMAFAERMFARSGHDKNPISVLMFDLDQFKSINDTFGHAMGDRALRVFADVLSRLIRPSDFAGRIGGEEFAAALPGCSIEAALAIANRVRAAFQADACFLCGQRVDATVSVGVASTSVRAGGLDEIMASADAALYQAKRLGRNRVATAARTACPLEQSIVRIA